MNAEKTTESELLEIIQKHKKFKPKKITVLIMAIALILAILNLCISMFPPKPSSPSYPWAKITTPSPGSITGEHVKVIGETRNIESGQYIWLAVDKPRLGLCWPKAPRLPSNTGFSTEIYEGGPEEPFTLSVYAVNKTVSDHWQDWLNKERDGGLPMPPENRRLVSVRLIKSEGS